MARYTRIGSRPVVSNFVQIYRYIILFSVYGVGGRVAGFLIRGRGYRNKFFGIEKGTKIKI